VTLSAITTRGGRLVILGTITMIVSLATTSTSVTFKLKRGATTIVTWTVGGFVQAPGTGNTLAIPFAFPVMAADLPIAGTYTYTVTGIVAPGAAGSVTLDSTNPGNVFAIEFA